MKYFDDIEDLIEANLQVGELAGIRNPSTIKGIIEDGDYGIPIRNLNKWVPDMSTIESIYGRRFNFLHQNTAYSKWLRDESGVWQKDQSGLTNGLFDGKHVYIKNYGYDVDRVITAWRYNGSDQIGVQFDGDTGSWTYFDKATKLVEESENLTDVDYDSARAALDISNLENISANDSPLSGHTYSTTIGASTVTVDITNQLSSAISDLNSDRGVSSASISTVYQTAEDSAFGGGGSSYSSHSSNVTAELNNLSARINVLVSDSTTYLSNYQASESTSDRTTNTASAESEIDSELNSYGAGYPVVVTRMSQGYTDNVIFQTTSNLLTDTLLYASNEWNSSNILSGIFSEDPAGSYPSFFIMQENASSTTYPSLVTGVGSERHIALWGGYQRGTNRFTGRCVSEVENALLLTSWEGSSSTVHRNDLTTAYSGTHMIVAAPEGSNRCAFVNISWNGSLTPTVWSNLRASTVDSDYIVGYNNATESFEIRRLIPGDISTYEVPAAGLIKGIYKLGY